MQQVHLHRVGQEDGQGIVLPVIGLTAVSCPIACSKARAVGLVRAGLPVM